MRKFLNDYESIVTIEELKNGEEFREFMEENPEEDFARYLDLCMWWNNGFLTEILTADTPKEARRGAVSLVAVFNREWLSDDINFPFVTWASARKIREWINGGAAVVPYLGKWECKIIFKPGYIPGLMHPYESRQANDKNDGGLHNDKETGT